MPLGALATAAISAGVNTISNIGQNVLGGTLQEKYNQKAYKRSLDYYNMQRQDALKDWQMQNDYNNPTNQLQRLKDAGISPYSMNGQPVVAGQSTQAPRGSQANVPSAYQVNTSQNMIQTMNMLTQAQLTKAQVDKTVEETKNAIEDRRGKQIINDDNERWLQSKSNSQIWLAQSQKDYIDASTEEKKAMLPNIKQQLLSVIEDVKLKRTQNVYQNDILKNSNTLQQSQIRVQNYQADKLKQEIDQLDKLNPHQVQQLIEQVRQLKNTNDKQDKFAPTDQMQRWSEIIGQFVGMFRR